MVDYLVILKQTIIRKKLNDLLKSEHKFNKFNFNLDNL